MEVKRQQLNQLLDEVADFGDDWPEVIDMIANAEASSEDDLLFKYLGLLVPRLRRMRRAFGYVTYEPKSRCYQIHNYTFDTYRWFLRRKFKAAVITPSKIMIAVEELTPEEQDQLRQRLVR